MKRRYVGLAIGAVIAVGAALSLPSCGHDQKLVSVAVTPQTAIYPTPQSSYVDFTATGTYIHPPATKDITNQVTWAADVPELLLINYNGVAGRIAPDGTDCGISNISATAPEGTGGAGNIVIGYATVTVQDPTNPLCPGGSTSTGELVVTPAGTGTGTVVSAPAGISCPGTACGAQFPAGELVTLTATANAGSTFATWAGCTPSPTNPDECTATVPGGGVVNVTATFNSP